MGPFVDLQHLSSKASQSINSPKGTPTLETHFVYDSRQQPPSWGNPQPITLTAEPPHYGAIILPAGDDPESLETLHDPELASWLRYHYEQECWLYGIGSGVLWLAATGLLDSAHASIPPRHSMAVGQLFPQIKMGYVGSIIEHNRIITAAETASVFAVVVMLARRIHSHGLAEQYRRQCGIPETMVSDNELFPIRRNQDILVAEARAWIIAHMQQNIDTQTVAKQFHVSAKTLTRRFERSTGVTPTKFLRNVRLDAALSMLKRTRFSIEQIAQQVGYQDVGFFRKLFRTHTGYTPRELRNPQPSPDTFK
jgi:transcriptional regulator GlxA family with amidase domain